MRFNDGLILELEHRLQAENQRESYEGFTTIMLLASMFCTRSKRDV